MMGGEETDSQQDLDTNGDQTVGYGHLCKRPNCAEVKYSIPLTVADGKKLLADDIAVRRFCPFSTRAVLIGKQGFEQCVTGMCNDGVVLNANEYGAVVSWAFNVGCNAAKGSQLVRRLNAGQNPDNVLLEELIKWINDNNGPLEGLRRRRKAEIALSQTATSQKALPVVC